MPTEVLMPALSPTMEEGTLAKWLVKEGDQVESGDLLAEIETDKATMEFEAAEEGTIGRILVAGGTESVKVNTPIAVLLGEGEDANDIDTDTTPREGPVSSNAEPAAASQPTAPAQGYGGGPDPNAGGGTQIGAQAQPRSDQREEAAPAPGAPTANGERIFASPLARRIARDRGLDLGAIKGSGPKGRIVKADVESARPSQATAMPAAAPAAEAKSGASAEAGMPSGPSADAVMQMYQGRAYEEMKLDGMRRTVAARLTEAKQTIPHFYLRREVTLDPLLKFRSDLNKQLEARGVKLSVNDFVIKASALALQTVPDANAVWARDRILKLKPSDVAVAVAVEGGLFTPVLKDAEMKSLSSLSAEMKDLATRARDRKLSPEEYQGGTFAISNLGMYGIENFDAVINPPHGGILAVGSGVKKPVVGEDGEITTATMMSMTLSVDHRVIDGALGAQLLDAIIANLENPMVMLA